LELVACSLIDDHLFQVDGMRAEIAQGPSRDIGDRVIGRGGLKPTVVRGYLQEAEEIIVNALIDTIHLYLQGIPLLQIAAVIE
jgi:hypothetical protein